MLIEPAALQGVIGWWRAQPKFAMIPFLRSRSSHVICMDSCLKITVPLGVHGFAMSSINIVVGSIRKSCVGKLLVVLATILLPPAFWSLALPI